MTTSQLGRTIAVTWPDVGDTASGWVATIQASVTELSNNTLGRLFTGTAVADSTDTEFTHNLGIAKDYLRVVFFSGTGASKTVIQDPIGAGWTITVGTTAATQIKIGTPAAGGPHTFSVIIVDAEVYRETIEQLITTTPGSPPANTVIKWRDANGRGLYKLSTGVIGTRESLPIKHVSSAFNALPGFHYVVDTSGGVVTGTMNATIQDYDVVQFSDAKKTFNTNNLTLARNGKNIDGITANFVFSTARDGGLFSGDNAAGNWVRSAAGAAGTPSAATPTTAGFVTSYADVVQSRIKIVSSANYTILDTDGFDQVIVTAGAIDRTMTLPTAAANTGRLITFFKADSGVGKVIIDGEGAEKINNQLTQELFGQYGQMTIAGNGTEWFITAQEHPWVSFTPVSPNSSHVFTTPTALYRRRGQNMELQAHYTQNSAAGIEWRMTIPDSKTVASGMPFMTVGWMFFDSTGDSGVEIGKMMANPTDPYIRWSPKNNGLQVQNANAGFGATAVVLYADVRIAEWS